ncbi:MULTISPECIES: hypothetical protein [unclassified Okeania]|nr:MULTISPECIES: hypothetical protein [unclassified Okeania]NES78939.1 hypothetical protein [Okeania sp. SIO1H4]NET12952.1 hypothetical protein [Okeania sp. SIO1H6]NET22535.1 hypothetical protein [Okeania sp. SIO1H5]NET95660.1 hypothetical protein [Okeania sp. SIO1H2]
MSHDSFYETGKREAAEEWQKENDKVFIEEKAFADKDMRMFAYTFGSRKLEDTKDVYYENDMYNTLKSIKETIDPNCIFSADEFSLSPNNIMSVYIVCVNPRVNIYRK